MKTTLKTVAIDLQKIALELGKYDDFKSIPDPVVNEIENLVRDIQTYRRVKSCLTQTESDGYIMSESEASGLRDNSQPRSSIRGKPLRSRKDLKANHESCSTQTDNAAARKRSWIDIEQIDYTSCPREVWFWYKGIAMFARLDSGVVNPVVVRGSAEGCDIDVNFYEYDRLQQAIDQWNADYTKRMSR